MLENIDNKYKLNGLYNYFNATIIKNRIKMMTKNKSPKVKMIRYFLLLPSIAF
jgi:hypothetical protein